MIKQQVQSEILRGYISGLIFFREQKKGRRFYDNIFKLDIRNSILSLGATILDQMPQ